MFISVPISDSIEGDKGRLLEINLFHLKSLLDFKLRIILLLINCIFSYQFIVNKLHFFICVCTGRLVGYLSMFKQLISLYVKWTLQKCIKY